MIRLFIYQTYNSCKLDKKNQSIHQDTLKLISVGKSKLVEELKKNLENIDPIES